MRGHWQGGGRTQYYIEVDSRPSPNWGGGGSGKDRGIECSASCSTPPPTSPTQPLGLLMAPTMSDPDVQLLWCSDFQMLGSSVLTCGNHDPLYMMREESTLVVRSGRSYGNLTGWNLENQLIKAHFNG